MSEIKVSIIVPIYNVEKYIKRCMDSLMSQAFIDYEIIAINDGTLDDSMQYVYKLQKRSDEIIICERENGGLSAARNTGIGCARGEYILFCDSDDALQENCLSSLYEEAKKKNLDLLLYDAQIIYELENEKKENLYDRDNITEEVLSGEEMLEELVNKKKYRASACLYLIKRDMLIKNDILFFESILHEDELFTPIVLMKAQRVAHRNWLFYKRYVREGSITTSDNMAKRLRSLGIVIDELVKYVNNEKVSSCDGALRKVIIEHIKFFLGQTLLLTEIDDELKNIRKRVREIVKQKHLKLEIKFVIYIVYLHIRRAFLIVLRQTMKGRMAKCI